MGSDNVRIELGATQQAFITSHAEADLFSCRMGEGKSTALCWAIFFHTQHNPGAQWALIRDTWSNLEGTTLREFFKWFPDGIFVDYQVSKKRIIWRPESGLVGDITCIGMDQPVDAQKVQSRELAGFAMDEPAPAADQGGIDEFIFTTLMTRLRQPGMKWYSAKLAQNSSDETHWTYPTFYEPGNPGDPDIERPPEQSIGYRVFETARPENLKNLPAGYYTRMAANYRRKGRHDLADRFAEGKVGFQQPGRPVTPEFSRQLHVAPGLLEISSAPLCLLWDFGGNPTCIFTQTTPLGHWNILESHVSDGKMGVFELIEEVIAGRVNNRFHGAELLHYGDPAGMSPEQSSSRVTAVKVLKEKLGGRWFKCPDKYQDRVQPLRSVLGKTRNGTGLVQIDEHDAKAVWHALRGGWHYRIGPNGVAADRPIKNNHSHPGDAMGYGAAELFPGGSLKHRKRNSGFSQRQVPSYGVRRPVDPIEEMFGAKPDARVPEDGDQITTPAPPRNISYRSRRAGRG